MANGECVIDDVTRPSDLGCSLWDWENQVCLECSNRFYRVASGRCLPVDDNCRTFDLDGSCLTCYKGYILNNNGVCLPDPQNDNPPTDLGCGLWDWDNQRCLECSQGYFVNTQSGQCIPVSDLCQTHD